MSILSRANFGTKAAVQTISENIKEPNSEFWFRAESPMRAFGYGAAGFVLGKFSKQVKDLAHRTGHIEVDHAGDERTKKLGTQRKAQLREFVIQDHHADRAGRHYDLRIEEGGVAHSWAIPKATMPTEMGKQQLAVQQPSHTVEYMDFEGVIEDGYGKGPVYQHNRGQVEVMYMDNNHVDFVIYTGPDAGRYGMTRMHTRSGEDKYNWDREGKPSHNWMIFQKKDGPKTPPHIDRPPSKYISVKQEFDLDTHIVTKKYDGTHSIMHLNTKAYNRNILASRRPPAESNTTHRARGGILHQEDHLPWIRDMEIAIIHKFLKHVEISQFFRAAGVPYSRMRVVHSQLADNGIYKILFEVEDFDKSIFHVEVHHHLGHSHTSGILNSNPLKGRETQAKTGNLQVTLLDVRQYQGEDVRDMTYEERFQMMQRFADYHPEVEMPEQPAPGETHREFHERLVADKQEGTIAIHKEQTYGGTIYKIKGPMDHNYSRVYYIVGFTEGQGKYRGNGVGAVYYSDSPNGKPLGKASGMSDHYRRDMHQNQDEYLGKEIIIESAHPIENDQAVRAPNIVDVDKGKEPTINN